MQETKLEYAPLHQKYRPMALQELVGQEAVCHILRSAIVQDRMPNAFLFAGERGTGKTTTARIVARSLNCRRAEAPTVDPCGSCDTCKGVGTGAYPDYIEINGACNTGIDAMSDLKDALNYGMMDRWRVVMIDEAHCLSEKAQNSLLDIFENPPKRTLFILGTTDPQGLQVALVSRTMQLRFNRIPLDSIQQKLADTCRLEGYQGLVEPLALMELARRSEGSMRDAEILLEPLLSRDEITVRSVGELYGTPDLELLESILRAAYANMPLSELIDELLAGGGSVQQRLNEIVMLLVDLALISEGGGSSLLEAELLRLVGAADIIRLNILATSLGYPEIMRQLRHLWLISEQIHHTSPNSQRLWLEVGLTELRPVAHVQVKEPQEDSKPPTATVLDVQVDSVEAKPTPPIQLDEIWDLLRAEMAPLERGLFSAANSRLVQYDLTTQTAVVAIKSANLLKIAQGHNAKILKLFKENREAVGVEVSLLEFTVGRQ